MRGNISVLFTAFSLVTYVFDKERISYACEVGEEPKSMEYLLLYTFLKKHCDIHSGTNQLNLRNPGWYNERYQKHQKASLQEPEIVFLFRKS